MGAEKYEAQVEGSYFRIRALRDIPRHNVKKGDMGGLIEKQLNLSQKGDCWIESGLASGEAEVFGNALITDNSQVTGHAQICGDAVITGKSSIDGYVTVEGKSLIKNSGLYGVSHVDNSIITDAALTNAFQVKRSNIANVDISNVSQLKGARICRATDILQIEGLDTKGKCEGTGLTLYPTGCDYSLTVGQKQTSLEEWHAKLAVEEWHDQLVAAKPSTTLQIYVAALNLCALYVSKWEEERKVN